MSIKIYTYQDPYRLNAEPFWKEITNCPYFCVSQTLVNGLKGLYRADFQQGRVTTVKNLTDSIFEQWESTECIIKQHADLDNLVKAGALAVLKEPMQHNLADVLSFNRENIFQSIRVMAELNINLDEIRMEELTQEQGLVVTLYKRLMASEKHTDFVLETDFGPEELDAALVRAMQKAKDGFDASSLQKDRVVIHGVHQFTPIMLRAIETIARYKEVILLFPYQQQYKNVYQTWVNIYSAFDSQSQNFGGMDRGLVWADASRNSANILADRIGRLMEGRLESLSPTSFDVIEFDNVTEFADYAANIFERAVQKNPSSPMSGMSEQIYAADSSVNNILMMKYSNLALRILNEYSVALQSRKARALSETITACYKKLASKKNLIERIEMDPETLDVHYFGEDGMIVDQGSLSAGEKQLMVISILWALAICSKKKLPVIIDTPLSRLDSTHRAALVTTYFPQASEQTIILSTDSEIDRHYYDMMQEYIGDEFTLNYSEETKSTTISRGYFQER